MAIIFSVGGPPHLPRADWDEAGESAHQTGAAPMAARTPAMSRLADFFVTLTFFSTFMEMLSMLCLLNIRLIER